MVKVWRISESEHSELSEAGMLPPPTRLRKYHREKSGKMWEAEAGESSLNCLLHKVEFSIHELSAAVVIRTWAMSHGCQPCTERLWAVKRCRGNGTVFFTGLASDNLFLFCNSPLKITQTTFFKLHGSENDISEEEWEKNLFGGKFQCERRA